MKFIPVIPGLTYEHFVAYDKIFGGENDDTNSDGTNVVTKIPRLKIARIKKGSFCFRWEAKISSASTSKPPPQPQLSPLPSISSFESTSTTTTATTLSLSIRTAPVEDKGEGCFHNNDNNRQPKRLSKGSLSKSSSSSSLSFCYKIYARGNILRCQSVFGLRQWWGFKCSCTCPTFARAKSWTIRNGETKNYVCEHLHAALLSVIDPEGFIIEPPEESVIPGLTTQHFVNGNVLHGGKCHYQPIMKRAHVDSEGYFHFVWEAVGGAETEKSYELCAHGHIRTVAGNKKINGEDKCNNNHIEEENDHNEDDKINDNDSSKNNDGTTDDNENDGSKNDDNNTNDQENDDNNDDAWWGFETYCTCPHFGEQYNRRVRDRLKGNNCHNFSSLFIVKQQNYVCKHLAAALESVIDPVAQVTHELSNMY